MKLQFRLVLALLILMFFLTIGSYLRFWSLSLIIGPFFLAHWFAIIGASYILLATITFSMARRFSSANRALLLKIHTLGNLFISILIFMHFAHHLGHPPEAYPQLGTGLSSQILILMILPTGILLRFGVLSRQRDTWRVIHIGVSISLFILIMVHTLITLNIL